MRSLPMTLEEASDFLIRAAALAETQCERVDRKNPGPPCGICGICELARGLAELRDGLEKGYTLGTRKPKRSPIAPIDTISGVLDAPLSEPQLNTGGTYYFDGGDPDLHLLNYSSKSLRELYKGPTCPRDKWVYLTTHSGLFTGRELRQLAGIYAELAIRVGTAAGLAIDPRLTAAARAAANTNTPAYKIEESFRVCSKVFHTISSDNALYLWIADVVLRATEKDETQAAWGAAACAARRIDWCDLAEATYEILTEETF